MKKIAVIFLIVIIGLGFIFFCFRDTRNNVFEEIIEKIREDLLKMKSDLIRFYNFLTKKFEKFRETELGTIVTQTQKEFITPPPLEIKGKKQEVILVKSKIIEETNLQRQKFGMKPLNENLILDKIALEKARDIFENQYFDHVSPTGVKPTDLFEKYGYEYILAAENLILGNFSSEKEVVEKWMESIHHRENILNSRFSEIGVAVVKGIYKGQQVWVGVQEFALPLSACPLPDKNLEAEILQQKNRIDALFELIKKKKEEIERTSFRAPYYNQLVKDYNEMVKEYNQLLVDLESKIDFYNSQVNNFNNCVLGK